MTQPYGFTIRNTYRDLPKLFYADSLPMRFVDPSYTFVNRALADELRLDIKALRTERGCRFLIGETGHDEARPLAMAYAGHQYGQFTVLGDGRAHLRLEHDTSEGLLDIHLKGSGKTPFSRGFDGRATLRSALLEYLYSEALCALGVPTTRSLAIITTGDEIKRIGPTAAAVLVRVAKSHLRVGTFEYAAHRGDLDALKALADFAIERHDADLSELPGRYLTWYKRIIARQAALIAQWQAIGFVHGVMNTDNTAISGESIDYGPCAFIDNYDLNAVYSSIDAHGRYAYGNQPYIGSWNLAKLGEAILPLIDADPKAARRKTHEALVDFGPQFEHYYRDHMGKKLGFASIKDRDDNLIQTLLGLMETYDADYTATFTALTTQRDAGESLFDSSEYASWKTRWQARLHEENTPFVRMQAHNPAIIPRNQVVKSALDKAAHDGDFGDYMGLLEAVRHPFDTAAPRAYRTVPKNKEPFVTYCGT